MVGSSLFYYDYINIAHGKPTRVRLPQKIPIVVKNTKVLCCSSPAAAGGHTVWFSVLSHSNNSVLWFLIPSFPSGTVSSILVVGFENNGTVFHSSSTCRLFLDTPETNRMVLVRGATN